jgi:hypothetical protein
MEESYECIAKFACFVYSLELKQVIHIPRRLERVGKLGLAPNNYFLNQKFSLRVNLMSLPSENSGIIFNHLPLSKGPPLSMPQLKTKT